MSGVVALLRRLRTDRAVTAAVAVSALLLTAGTVATWRSFTDVSDATLRKTVVDATATERDLFARATGLLEPGRSGAALEPVDAVGTAVGDGLPDELRRLVRERVDVVEARPYEIVPPAGAPLQSLRRLLLTVTPAAEGAVRVVEGRLPQAGRRDGLTAEQRRLERDLYATRIRPPVVGDVGPVLEVALTPESARMLGTPVGTSTLVAADPTDPVVRRLPVEEQRPLAIEVVGLVEPSAPDDPLWTTDTRVNRPSAVTDESGSRETITTGALLAPGAYADLTQALSPVPLTFTWRYGLAGARLHTGDLTELQRAVDRPPAPISPVTGLDAAPTVTTGLGNLADEFAARRTAASTLLSLAGAGLAGAAAVMLALLARLTAVRRAAATRLVRDRGAGTRQVVGAMLTEALVVVVPAAAAGAALAWALVPARATRDSVLLTAGIAVGLVALLVLAGMPSARLQSGATDEDSEAPAAARRVVLEVLAATLAVVALVALRRRGVGAGGEGGGGGADPYLAAAPVLLAVAVAIPVLRAYPLPLRLLARRAERRPRLVPFLGLTRALAAARVSPLPLLALLLSVGLAAFATVLASTVAAGQRSSAAYTVGADYRLDVPAQLALGAGVSNDLGDLAALPGVTGLAVGVAEPQVEVESVDRGLSRPALVAVDLAAYADVARGTEVEGVLPTSMSTEDGDVLAAAVTRTWTGGSGRPAPGQRLKMTAGAGSLEVEVTHVVEVVPGLPPGRPGIVVDHAALRQQIRGFDRVNRVYLAGSAAARGPLVERVGGRADLTDRRAVLAGNRSGALLTAALDGVTAAAAAATVIGGLALVLGVLLTARVRDRELVLLRALGLSDRFAGRLVAVETVPLVATGLVVGGLLGVGLVPLALPGIDPTSFTGPLPSVPTVVDPRWLLLVLAVVTAVAVVAVLVPAAVARRTTAGGLLRIGDT